MVVLLTYGSCKEVSELTHFYFDYTYEIIIPPNNLVGIPIDITTPYIPTNSDDIFNKYNTSSDLIEKITLSVMKMNIKSPSSQSFDFLKSIDIYILADSLSEVKIAWNDDIPQTGLSSINMETSDDDLQEFIKKDEFKLHFRTILRQPVLDSTDIEIISTFFADAILFGL